jgi:hypothetical protein
MRKLKCFGQLTADQRSTLLRVLVTVVAARVALWVLPVEATRKIITRAAIVTAGSVEQVVWAVRAASRLVPRASCLTQAIAAQSVLARSGIPSQVEIGVSKNQSRLHAHAWVVCQGQVVLGGGQIDRYHSLIAWKPTGVAQCQTSSRRASRLRRM